MDMGKISESPRQIVSSGSQTIRNYREQVFLNSDVGKDVCRTGENLCLGVIKGRETWEMKERDGYKLK